MDVRGLRIGNLIQIKTSKSIIISEVKALDITKDECLINNESPIIYEPVPLTKIRLAYYGFDLVKPKECVDENTGQPYYIDRYKLKHASGVYIIAELYDDELAVYINGARESIELYYVHQLQNLYYALSGEELKVK